jgi:hypothetical protein
MATSARGSSGLHVPDIQGDVIVQTGSRVLLGNHLIERSRSNVRLLYEAGLSGK